MSIRVCIECASQFEGRTSAKACPPCQVERHKRSTKASKDRNRDHVNAAARERYWRNRTAEIARKKAFREDNREELRVKARKFYAENQERIREQKRAKYLLNRRSENSRNAKYRRDNHERLLNQWRRYNRENSADRSSMARKREQENPAAVERYERRRRSREIAAAKAVGADRWRKWTPEEDKIAAAWTGGLVELACILRRSRSSVVSRRTVLRKRAALGLHEGVDDA